MKNSKDYRAIFMRYDGVMKTKELSKEGVSYAALQKLVEAGEVEKVRYGYYQWQDEKAFTEVSALTALFPDAIICGLSALMYYDYTDRVPREWHLAVDDRTERRKFKAVTPRVKPHFIKPQRLNIGMTEGEIDGVFVKIYDRERVMCDCLRNVNTMDGEIYNTAIRRYIQDENKNAARLMEYAKILGVENKARRTIGIWL